MRKRFLQILIVLIGCFVFTTKCYSRGTTLMVDSVPKLSNDVAFNLMYNSLIYWHLYALSKDSILNQQSKILQGYYKITGIQTNNEQLLMDAYGVRTVLEKGKEQRIEELEKNLKSVNRRKNVWKVGTFVLVPTALVGGIVLGVKIAK